MQAPEIMELRIGTLAVKVFGSYRVSPSKMVRVRRLVLGNDNKIQAECQEWQSSLERVEKKKTLGKKPASFMVILCSQTISIPLEDFMAPIDVIHHTKLKEIPWALREGVFAFSHAENQKGQARVVSAAALPMASSSLSKRRQVGGLIRAELGKLLRKGCSSSGRLYISFPFSKETVMDILQEHGKARRSGCSFTILIDDPALLDDLCGEEWDFVPQVESFFCAVVSLKIRNCRLPRFSFTYNILSTNLLPGQEYRDKTKPIFQKYFTKFLS